jgi:hypothetical protein
VKPEGPKEATNGRKRHRRPNLGLPERRCGAGNLGGRPRQTRGPSPGTRRMELGHDRHDLLGQLGRRPPRPRSAPGRGESGRFRGTATVTAAETPPRRAPRSGVSCAAAFAREQTPSPACHTDHADAARRFSEECSAPNCSRSTGAWGRTTSWRSCLRRDARLHRSGLRRQVPAPHRADLPRDSGCASTTMTEQEGKRGAGRERSGAAARNGPALCRGFSRLVWDVGVGAQRKAAL